jgi:Holliday junction DNA helicase RuvA
VIAYLRGVCQAVEDDAVVIDVQGVGYLVYVAEPDRLRHQRGHDAELLVHTEVREDAILLYGFATAAARELFRILLSVPGVGPKAALAMLSAMEPAQLGAAIVAGRVTDLTRAKGIGKKTAETIIVKLRDRMPSMVSATGAPNKLPLPGDHPLQTDLISALLNLGYRPQAAETVAQQVLADQPQVPLEQALRAALAVLRRPTISP